MALFAYYLKAIILSFFQKKSYRASKKDFYERQLNFTFLDWIFTPEGNKKTDAADIKLDSDTLFSIQGVALCNTKREAVSILGKPNYIYNTKAKAELKVGVLFYKLPIAEHNCLLQLYFVEKKLYCIDVKFADKNQQKKESFLPILDAILKDVLPGKIKNETISLVIENSYADLLSGKFYMHVENYFGFRISIIPHFSKYRSLISHNKNNRTAYHQL